MLIDYAATYPNAVIQYHASNMFLRVDYDAEYITMLEAQSCYARHFISVILLHRSRSKHSPNKIDLFTKNVKQCAMWSHQQQKQKYVEILIMEKQLSAFDHLLLR